MRESIRDSERERPVLSKHLYMANPRFVEDSSTTYHNTRTPSSTLLLDHTPFSPSLKHLTCPQAWFSASPPLHAQTGQKPLGPAGRPPQPIKASSIGLNQTPHLSGSTWARGDPATLAAPRRRSCSRPRCSRQTPRRSARDPLPPHLPLPSVLPFLPLSSSGRRPPWPPPPPPPSLLG